MRIACISSSQVPSKTANSIQLIKVCSALAEVGHEVRLWMLGADPQWSWDELASHYGVQASFERLWLPASFGPRGWGYSLKAVRAARKWEADLYYSWPYQASALTASMGYPTLMELHDRPYGRTGPFFLRRFISAKGARRIVITTEALRSWLAENYGAELAPPFAIVAPNGVDLERYEALPSPAKARVSAGLPENFTVGYTGHLYKGRGLDLMLELAQRFEDVTFVWAGGEAEAVEQWRGRMAALGVGNVRLMGFLPNEELPILQAACDVLVMPYEQRISVSSGGDTAAFASPMKAFEYLASGRAILASDLPVIREVLSESNSVLLPPDDSSAWIAALERLIMDPGQRSWLGAHAKEDAAGYSWTARAETVLSGLDLR